MASFATWLVLLVSGCFFISPVKSQFGFFGPLLPPATVYNISTSTVSQTVGTICYVTGSTSVTQCRRKRGIEQQPILMDHNGEIFEPSPVERVEVTAEVNKRSADYKKGANVYHLTPAFLDALAIASSKTTREDRNDEALHSQIQGRTVMNNFFNRLAVAEPRDVNMFNSIVVSSSCAGQPLDFSQLLTCIGVTVQQTTTYTATLTVTDVATSGSTRITLGGCTPTNFPYPSCSA